MSYSSLTNSSKLFQCTALTIALALAGCGGGGDGDTVDSIAPKPDTGLIQVTPNNPNTGNPGSEDVSTQASEIYLSSNYSGINIVKGSSVEVTALVLDENNGNLAEQPVTFKITNPNLTGVFSDSQSSIVTDENGKAVVRLVVTNALTTAQKNYLLSDGLTVEASVGNASQSITLLGSNNSSELQKQDVYDVFIASDKTQLLTGEDETQVSIRVTDKQGGIVEGVPVIISITDAALYGLSLDSPSRQITNDEGLVEVNLVQTKTGIDAQLNHESLLTVVVNDNKNSIVEQSLPIIVSGTRATDVTASKGSVSAGDNFRVSGRILDGATNSVANADVILYSNGIEAGVGRTNAEGRFVFDLNASSITAVDNQYIFSVEVRGTNSVQRIPDIQTVALVSSSNIGFSLVDDIIVGTKQKIVLSVPNAVNGDNVAVSTNKGKIFATPDESDAQGSSRRLLPVTNRQLVFYTESNVPGTATVRADYGSDSKEEVVNYVSIEPSKLILQIERAVLSTGGATSVIARVLDKDDAPVKNAIVQFTTVRDASGGSLSQGFGYTNNNGLATVTYNAGQNPTSTDGVEIEARVQSIRLPNGTEQDVDESQRESLIKDAAITVQTKSTFISFAFADKVSVDSRNVYYFRKGSISVLNSTGKPAVNQTVTINLIPQSYDKGYYFVDFNLQGEKVWGRNEITCENEDENNNGILDAGEDFNDNGKLDPVNITTVIDDDGQIVGSGQNFNFVTDDTGKVDFSVRYFKEYARWYKAKITVNTSVDGSESQQARVIDFPALIDDIDINSNPPLRPNFNSPFGIDFSTCSNDR
ncbi:hypothetical protein [Psychrobacter sp. DM4]|uniref:hypothetical protein n=1 Tax=Psychrobacter sp. DM4 TaxID=3440637 RepID=UPI003F4F58B0